MKLISGGGTYVKPYVGYDSEHVHYNELRYEFLDILYADENGNKKVDSTVLDPSLGYTPIGLCVAKTGFFGAGEKARWMSLKYMNYTTPETGSLTRQYIYWGKMYTDIPTIDNIETTHNGGSYYGYLSGEDKDIPSLFDANGNWNLSELGEVNKFAVTDIDGKNKTEKIIATATSQSDWRTATTITNIEAAGFAPAACCCARYHTLGTQPGDWYLGACGEMSMISLQSSEIDDKLSQIKTKYNNDCISSLDYDNYFSSTEISTHDVYAVYLEEDEINEKSKSSGYNVISMLQY